MADEDIGKFLEEWESEQKMGDRLEVDFDTLYKVEIVSTFDGTSEDTGSDYTGYRLGEESPMAPSGVFFLSGVARKTMNETLQYSWKDPTVPIKVKFVKQLVKKPGKRDYHAVKAMVVDNF